MLIYESEKKKSCEVEKLNNALFVSQPERKSAKCHSCKKSGHYASDCYKKKNDLKKKKNHAKLTNGDESSINKSQLNGPPLRFNSIFGHAWPDPPKCLQ